MHFQKMQTQIINYMSKNNAIIYRSYFILYESLSLSSFFISKFFRKIMEH